MTSEFLYVNCQDLHNPTFTPRALLPQRNVSASCRAQMPEVTVTPDVELVSSSVNVSALEHALPDPSSHLEIGQEEKSDILPELRDPQMEPSNGQVSKFPVLSVASETPVEAQPSPTSQTNRIPRSCGENISPGSISILVSPTEVWRVPPSLPETPPEKGNVLSQSGSQEVHSLPGNVAEHEAIASVPTESTPAFEEPITSSKDDEVQFILSVTRKKRRKRLRVEPLTDEQGKDTARHISNDAGQSATLHSHQAGLSYTAAQSLFCHHPQICNSQCLSSIPSASPGPLLITGPPSVALVPENSKQTTRKRKRNQECNLGTSLQALGATNVNNGMISAKMPIPHRNPETLQHLCSTGSNSSVHQVTGTKQASNSQPLPGSAACCSLHGQSSPDTQTRTTVVQTYSPSLGGPVTNSITTPLNSMSESLRRRPSLYAVPQWPSSPPRSEMARQNQAANTSSRVHQSPYTLGDGTLPGVYPVLTHVAGAGNIPPVEAIPSSHFSYLTPSQILSTQKLTSPPTEALSSHSAVIKQLHPPNMLVDIAQTCQDNFPFALIAKRHNQPLQKVFETFSAVIQLPLLRSAVDPRRPGKLGSLRMKELRVLKKGLKEAPKGEQAMKKRGRKGKVNGKDDK